MHSFNHGMYSTRSMRVIRMLVQRTGTYDEQFLRPYISTGNGTAINTVASKIVQSKSLTAGIFSSEASEIIRPSPRPETAIGIENGWGTERLRYFLHLEHTDQMGSVKHIHVTGYSAYADLSYGNHVDPKVPFIINGISITTPILHRGNNGEHVVHKLSNVSQVVQNKEFQGAIISDPSTRVYSLSPDSVFSAIQANEMNYVDSQDCIDARQFITAESKLIGRGFNTAQAYCAEVTNAWKHLSSVDDVSSQYGGDVYGAVADTLQQGTSVKDEFIRWLKNRRMQVYGYVSGQDTQFTLEDLDALDPNFRNVLLVAPAMRGMYHAGQACSWDGSDALTQGAAILAQSVPAYMSKLGISKVALKSSNKYNSTNMTPMTIITSVDCINNSFDNSRVIEAFKYQLDTEVFNGLCYSGQLPYELDLIVDMYGETIIALSLGNTPVQMYVAPTFADALYTPQVTVSQSNLYGLANDFKNIFDASIEQKFSNSTLGFTTGAINI